MTPPPSGRPSLAPNSPPDDETTPVYTERLLPGPGGWFGVVVFSLVLGIALSVVDGRTAVIVGVVTFLVSAGAAWWTSPVISVSHGVLTAGRAHIPTTELGAVVLLDRAGVQQQMGTGWDARAYACLRTWAGGGIRVEVTDPQDATPFWVVSSRRAHDLAAAISAQR